MENKSYENGSQTNIDTLQSKKSKHDNGYYISWIWPIFFILFGCLTYYLVHLNDHVLPTVISGDEADENPGLFSGERSKESLIKLCAIGPRLCGHESAEKFAIELIVREVEEAIHAAHPAQKIQYQVQKGSGDFYLEYKIPFMSVYVNIQNVLVLFEGYEGNHGIVVNCHTDTVPEVEGASDDGISCAVMLELVRVMASRPERLKHNVVFLFNGAEEAGLMGAHLFLQHEWSKTCRVLINLEAAGLGGRSILFQSGPQHPWIFNYYAKYAPHPHALVFGEELFQARFIPSDTDFRVFRDFGNIPGLDFAFCRNGHVYHTKYDAEKYILAESHQHMGDNTLAILTAIGNAPEMDNMEEYASGKTVYYDYLGWFMIYYSYVGSIVLNICIVILSLLSIAFCVGHFLQWSWVPEITEKQLNSIVNKIKSKFDADSPKENDSTKLDDDIEVSLDKKALLIELLIYTCGLSIGMGTAIGVTAIIGLIINSAATLAMPWYTNVWLLFPLYWCPCMTTYALVPCLVQRWRQKIHKLPVAMTAQMNLIAIQLIFTIIFFVLTCAGIRSAVLLFLPVLCPIISNFIIYLTPLYKTSYAWIWVYLIVQIPALLMNMYYTLIVYVIFTPVMARSGVMNGDLYISVVTAIFCIYVTSFAIPLMTLVRKPTIVFVTLALFSFVLIVLSLTTEMGHPYSAGPMNPRPQRYWIIHTTREFRNQTGDLRRSESGYFLLNQDINSPRTVPVKSRSALRSLDDDCEAELYCGLPYWLTRMIPLGPTSSWLPAGPPILPASTIATQLVSSTRSCNQGSMLCTFDLAISGLQRITVTFSPYQGATLEAWSLNSDPIESEIRKNSPHYYLHIVGKIEGIFTLSLTFKVNREQVDGGPVFEIGIAGNYVHHQEFRTKEYQAFLDSFPVWTDKHGWISSYKAHVF